MNSRTPPLRLGVLISGGGRSLVNLQQEIDAGNLHAEIVLVIASRPCAGIDRARKLGLRVETVAYRDFSPDRLEDYSARIAELLDDARAELVCLAGFLSKWIVPDRYAGRVLNIHPALLPKFGGQGMFGHHVHEAVLAAGETESGCTVHEVTNDYDAGPVVLQRNVPVRPDDTPESLAERVFAEECTAYPQAIRRFAERIAPNRSE